MFGTEEGPGLSTMPEDFNPFDIFEQFFQDLGGSGGFHRGSSGGTRFSFNNGNGTFTVFSSGFGSPFFHEFGEDDDNDINPFEDIFFGRSRTINRERNSRRNRTENNNRNSYEENNRNNNRYKMRRRNETNFNNIAFWIQLFPLICFLFTFVVIPWCIKNLFS